MAREKLIRRGGISGAAKRNLGGQDVQARVGAIQEQAPGTVSEKVLDQPLVKPGGVRGRSTSRRRVTAGVGLGPKPTGLKQAKIGSISTPSVALGPLTEKKAEPRQIGTSVLRKEGGVDVLRGTNPPATQQRDFTRGSAVEVAVAKKAKARALAKTGRGVRRGKDTIDIFATAGRLAESLASPEAQAERKLARGAAVRRKGKRADVKLANERIKALSSTLANIPELEENEEIRNKITGQITDLITKREADQKDPVLAFAEQAKSAGFGSDEIKSLATRLFPQA